jgi:hypothetical protein
MSPTDPAGYTERLYALIPQQYRTYDAGQGRPLLALLTVIGEQAANLRADLDTLWDNFFIETCGDWAVPYLGALVGTNLLADPVGQSNRLDVWNTVRWRRWRGTPAMLQTLASAITGWPGDVSEFFQALGWSQNLNHLRPDHPLTPDLRDVASLAALGTAADPVARAADFKPEQPFDQPPPNQASPAAPPPDQARVDSAALGLGRPGWVTPGRYQIDRFGVFLRRLTTFPLRGVTPAGAPPGTDLPPGTLCFTFDPLHRETPLFAEQAATPITRTGLAANPWPTFGTDVSVRQFGVLLARDTGPEPSTSSSATPFTFGGAAAGLALDAAEGLRLTPRRGWHLGGLHFVITAGWDDGGPVTALGAVSTLLTANGDPGAYRPGAPTLGPGQLTITVAATVGWPGLPPSAAGRFPGAVVAVRAAATTSPRTSDARYVYLPAGYVIPGMPMRWWVADDGSTYNAPNCDIDSLARESQGQVQPPRALTASMGPAASFTSLQRSTAGLRVADRTAYGSAGIVLRAELFTGALQPLAALASVSQQRSDYPELDFSVLGPGTGWPAFVSVPSTAASGDQLPAGSGMLCIRITPAPGVSDGFCPAAELVVTSRDGRGLLVYLPELSGLTADGVLLFVADDGTTFTAPPDEASLMNVLRQGSLDGQPVARASAGQVLPLAGIRPLQQRVPVSVNLCRCERAALLEVGEVGVDPELGRFALPAGDPAIGQGGLTADYVEAFSDRVGARPFLDRLDPAVAATRLVSSSGDALGPGPGAFPRSRIHPNLAEAVAAAADGDVIEITDSATYLSPGPVAVAAPGVRTLTIRAGDRQRPCLAFYQADGTPAPASLRVAIAMQYLQLNGLLVSGGPVAIDAAVSELELIASTLDPLSAAGTGSLVAADADASGSYLVCRCITGALTAGTGVRQLTVADSIVDGQDLWAVAGALASAATDAPPAQSVRLERVTVLGPLHCVVLEASDTLLDSVALADDQQSGCIRFSRYETGSVLPRKFSCLPSEAQASACRSPGRCVAPVFNSRRFGRPGYAQLAAGCPDPIRTASDAGAEPGAFAAGLGTIRVQNLRTKLSEFMPAGLVPILIADT